MKENTQKNAGKNRYRKNKSDDNDKSVALPSNAEDHQEDLNDDEMAVFQKIMGEIDGQEEQAADTSSRSGDLPAGNDELTEKEQAELNNVLESMEVEDSGEEEPLDEDQQKAFDSIMAQIEGGDDEQPEGQAEVEAENADAPAETQDADADEEEPLDEDQQKAFDSIMAQIEGGDGDQPEDQAEAGTEDADTPAETQDADADEVAPLDEDQQKAFDSIMAQIEGGDGDQPEDQAEVEAEDADTPAETQDADADEEAPLDEDQQKAFDSIMAQIEGGDDDQPEGQAEVEAEDVDAPAETQDADPDEVAPLDEDQQKAFDSIMAQIGGGDGDQPEDQAEVEAEDVDAPAETQDADPDEEEPLDEDQQKAFDSIMAQIGGGDEEQPEDQAEIEADQSDDADQDDFAAQLEKVVKDAETDGDTDTEPQDDLDDDQQKAFDSIMAQIEGGDDEQPQGQTESKADQSDDADQDDFADQLEKVVKDAETDGDTDTEPEDDLDDDQQKAFDSIMAQIEGGDDEQPEDQTEPKADQSDDADQDDFAAQLEKVVKDAETDGDTDTEPQDDLDDDQQKAFDSIMAQIEGGDEDQPKDQTEPKADQSDDADQDDFAAQLKKVVKDAETDTEPQDDLDDDQQKAFESIMAQIESGDDAEDEATSAPEGDDTHGNDVVNGNGAKADEMPAEKDQQEAFEKIIGQIKKDKPAKVPTAIPKSAEQDKAQPLSNTVFTDSSEETAAPAVSKQTRSKDEPNPKKEKGDVDEPTATDAEPTPPEASSHLASTELEATRNAKKSTTEPDKKSGSKRRKVLITTFAAVMAILSVAAGAFWFWPRQQEKTAAPVVARADMPQHAESSAVATATHPPVTPSDTIVDGIPAGDTPVNIPPQVARLNEIGERLEQLRQELLHKKGEIEELRDYYQTGIDSEVNTILDSIRDSGRRAINLRTALDDAHISLGLSAIQRRNAYIRRLKVPVQNLLEDSETLLYLKRKAEMLALMAGRTSDIDVEGFAEQVDAVMADQRLRMDQLNIDDVDVIPLPMETIWQDIARHLPLKITAEGSQIPSAAGSNAAIWNAICEGDYSGKDRLTALSPKAAGCLANWNGKDLFLNNLTELSPDTARELARWEGEWLGLNGLTELSPEAAVHLARWKGKTLSLNGLSHLSPQVVAILSEWSGEQIELINLKHLAHWENPNIRLYFNESLQRKLAGAKN